MQNPWVHLNYGETQVLASEESLVDAFNERYRNDPDSKYRLQTHQIPEPFIGNPTAAVYLLGLNPGYSSVDNHWHKDGHFQTSVRETHLHKENEFPFYYFNPRFREMSGATWWSEKCRWLTDDVGSTEAVARNLFCIELFPYHSVRYRQIPKWLSETGLVPSSAYSAYLVRQAIHAEKIIVAMRAFRRWCGLVPELGAYKKVVCLYSPQNVSLSPNNVKEYDKVVGAMKA